MEIKLKRLADGHSNGHFKVHLKQYTLYIKQSQLGHKTFSNRPGVDPLIFQDFMNFQEDLAKALEGNDTATAVEQRPVATVEASS